MATHDELYATYEQVQLQRTEDGLIPDTYEQWLEKRVNSQANMLTEHITRIAEWADAHLNMALYRDNSGFGEIEFEAMQAGTQNALLNTLRIFGWNLDRDQDGYMDIRADHQNTRIQFGKRERISK